MILVLKIIIGFFAVVGVLSTIILLAISKKILKGYFVARRIFRRR